jgi:hypothetical protein
MTQCAVPSRRATAHGTNASRDPVRPFAALAGHAVPGAGNDDEVTARRALGHALRPLQRGGKVVRAGEQQRRHGGQVAVPDQGHIRNAEPSSGITSPGCDGAQSGACLDPR